MSVTTTGPVDITTLVAALGEGQLRVDGDLAASGAVISSDVFTDDQIAAALLAPPKFQPLDSTGALATLLAVVETLTVKDAADSIQRPESDLVNEAQAWAAAQAL